MSEQFLLWDETLMRTECDGDDVFAERRRELGILQQELADKAGISRSTLHTIEHGGSGVRWEKVAAVAEALGLDMAFTPKD